MLDRLINLLRPSETKASRTARLIQLESGTRARWTPRDYAALARQGYMCNAVVHRAVKLVAENVAAAPCLVYEGAHARDRHPLGTLLARPNPRQERAAFLETVCAHLLLAGNAYVEAVTASGPGATDVRELYALRPDRMRVVPGPDGWPEAYEYVVGARTLRFDQGAPLPPILHLAQFHPLDDHYGLSSLEAAAVAVEGGDGALRYKLSKESAEKTLSLLFQSDFDGRAEIGLAGDDDLRFKVSADGENWLDAIVIDHVTGEVSMPQTAPAEGGGNVPADLDLLLAQLALGLADALNVSLFLGASGNRFADSFATLDHVDVDGATDLDTSEAGVLKPVEAPGYTLIDRTDGTAIGNMVNGGGLAAAFDGVTDANDANSASLSSSGATGTVGKDWGSGVTHTVGKIVVNGTNQNGFGSGTGTVTFAFQGSSNGSDWTTLFNTTFANATSLEKTFTDADGINIDNAYRYHRVTIQQNSFFPKCAELTLFEHGEEGVGNVTVASQALGAASAPSVMKIVALTKHVDEIALGTDLVFEASRDGGTTWTGATMNDRFTANDIHVLESAAIDVSAQPSGTSVKWRVRTDNEKMVELHGVHIYWS